MKEKIKMDDDFYKNEICVLDWLVDDSVQKIRFSNRYEYKVAGKLHREDGPAIEFFDNVGDQYYLNGGRLSEDEWKGYKRMIQIDKMIQ
jgi:hypothetical protein